MPFDNRLSKKISNNKFIIPASFVFCAILLVAGVVLLRVRGIPAVGNPDWVYNIAGDIVCMSVGMAIMTSIVLAWRTSGNYNRIFVILLSVGMLNMFLDECKWLVDGIPGLWGLNIAVNVLAFCSIGSLLYFFWAYAVYALDLEGKMFQRIDIIAYVMLVADVVLSLLNIFFPFYFKVDPTTGIYERAGWTWVFSQVHTVFALVTIVLAIILSKTSLRNKLVIGCFISIPLATIALTLFRSGLTVHIVGLFIAIVFMYCILFTDHEKKIATTEEELSLATRIQSNMLPTIFPAFPEREEFDLYATMNPAREVGGDFYDYFFVDEDHLGIVIADVSGKGVPAALFMMASKILVQNTVMNGKGPKDALEAINNQISANNDEDMFLTLWLGVLDVRTGVLKAANAGHEYPAVQRANGHFDLLRDKHGFVIGGMSGLRYTEYEVRLTVGSKLYLYTDGVTEAANGRKELFGEKRLVESLRKYESGSAKDVIEGVRSDIASFVGSAPQFDDITMVCLSFKGPQGNE